MKMFNIKAHLNVGVRLPFAFEGEGGTAFDFPDVVDSVDVIPEKARGLYVEKDGKWTYQGVDALKNSLIHTRNEREAARKKAAEAAEFLSLGLTIDEIKTLKEERNKREEQKAKDEGNWESLRKQLEENHNNSLKEKESRIKKLETFLNKSLINDHAQRVLSDPEIEGNPLFLLPAIDGRVKIEETDDSFKVVVLREDGTPQLNATNEPATLKDLFLEFKAKEEWAGAFKGVNQSGSGASGNGSGKGGSGGASLKRSEMTPAQKVKFIQEHGAVEYSKLPMN